nr:hypothetical protein [Aquisediminimonas sediminicola]
MSETSHLVDPLPPDIRSEHRSEPVPPQPNRFVADVDSSLE